MLRASIAAEAAGVPTVSLVCEGFEGQARATGRGHGYDDMALGVLRGHVDAQDAEEMITHLLDETMDEIVTALTMTGAGGDDRVDPEPAALDLVASGTIDEINDRFAEQGWSDGLPFIPPTRSLVEAFLADSGHDPWKVLGQISSSGRDVTVWSVAVNGVMAGCESRHLPVLLAMAEILLDPSYGVEHSGNTTGADALVVVNGPSTTELGFNAGPGVLRDGTRANTAVGRWLRLYLRNVGGFTADQHDKATFGNTFRVVLAEDHDTLVDIGWPALSQDFGFGLDDDVVTMARMNSGAIVGSVYGSTPDQIVPYLADGLMRISGWDLTHVYGLGQGHYSPLLVLSPILARTFARAGRSKADVRQALFDHARMPAWRFEKLIGQWSNLTTGRRTLHELAAEGLVPAAFGESADPDRLVPIVTDPDRFRIAVAGDRTRTNAYVMSNDGPHGWWTARAIDRGPASDLSCEVPQ